jgi:hypothetical protein
VGRAWSIALVVALVAGITSRPDAHKPITSPFTFSADVRPIVSERCGRCHAPGGVAPMSLLTHVDSVPWGESLRMELLSGHMPPWRVDRGATRFRNPGGLTAKELNVLLTWVTGGTPAGDPTPADERLPTPGWTWGPPDALLSLPRVTLGADEPERTAEFVLPIEATDRAIRAADLLPGTPAVVRSATIEVQAQDQVGAVRDERLLSLWVPGDEPGPFAQGALAIPRNAKLIVRVRYRKTWEYERREMVDASRVALYFAAAPVRPVQRVALAPGAPVTLARASQALAIYPDPALSGAGVVVTATRPNGRRDELIAFHARPGWARRYWYREPVPLPRGTRLSVRITPESPALLPPGFVSPPPTPRRASTSRVFVNIAD